MPTDKPPVSFRISEEAKAMLEEMAERHGLTKTAIVEMAIRELARRGVAPIEKSSRPRKGNPPPNA